MTGAVVARNHFSLKRLFRTPGSKHSIVNRHAPDHKLLFITHVYGICCCVLADDVHPFPHRNTETLALAQRKTLMAHMPPKAGSIRRKNLSFMRANFGVALNKGSVVAIRHKTNVLTIAFMCTGETCLLCYCAHPCFVRGFSKR